jgi:methyltransferase (TIGR00027 family)
MKKGEPSRTAYKVAMAVLTLGEVPEMKEVLPAGIADATAQLLLASGAVGERSVRWSRSRRMASVYRAFDWMIPGQFEALGYRKAFCEREVREAIASGAGQVLVMGAGYDTLGWRLAPEFPTVAFFEIDEPATAALKTKGIAAMGPRDNLRLIAEDLGQHRLECVVAADERWNREARTALVAEGLVMYLPPDAVGDLFRQCAAVTGAGSRVAFSYIPAGADGRPDVGRWTGLMLWLQKMIGEPWLWSIRPDQLGAFLAEAGWEIPSAPSARIEKRGVEYFVAAAKNTREPAARRQ